VGIVIALLAAMLQMGAKRREDIEEEALRKLVLPHLLVLAGEDRNVSVREAAADVSLLVMVRHGPGEQSAPPRVTSSPSTDDIITISGPSSEVDTRSLLAQAEREVGDDDPAIRAYAVRNISLAIRNTEKVDKQNYSFISLCHLIDILQGLRPLFFAPISRILILLLTDPESFVYLNAVHALARLIDLDCKGLFPLFLSLYAEGSKTPRDSKQFYQAGDIRVFAVDFCPGPLSLHTRAVLAEVLSIALKRSGETAPLYVPAVVAVCVKICRARVSLPPSPGPRELDEQMRPIVQINLLERQVRYTDPSINNNDRPHESNQRVLDEAYIAADSVFLRQSAYSLLAEAMAVAGWSAGRHIMDVIDIAVGTLQMEKRSLHQEDAAMRRCILFLLLCVIK
jgi:hypothetical protein